MQFEVIFLLLFGFCHSAPHEGLPLLNPGGIGGIFKGPDSETIIIGPDGSEITSEQKGGVVVQEDGLANRPIIVAESEIGGTPIHAEEHLLSSGPIIASTGRPILASPTPILVSPSPQTLLNDEVAVDYIDEPLPVPSGAPLLAPSANLVAPIIDAKPIEIVEQDPHIIETEIIEAPDVEPQQSSDLNGPSGRIITKGSASIISGPASTTITEPRKIIIAPPRLAIETPQIGLAAPLQVATPLASVSLQSGPSISTVAPPTLSYSTTAAPLDLGISTAVPPLQGVSSTVGIDTRRIDLGPRLRESIPVIEYSSSNGVIGGQTLGSSALVSSTEAPIISSAISTIATDQYAPSASPPVPSAYLLPPEGSAGIASSTSQNIQRIPRIGDNIIADGRVDMDESLYRKHSHQNYHLPQVLGMALSRLYRKTPIKDKDVIVIDDKMGELSQNEISYDPRILPQQPDLSNTKYLAPALAQNGIDASEVNLAEVPLSQVIRLEDDAYSSRGYLQSNRYERDAKHNNN